MAKKDEVDVDPIIAAEPAAIAAHAAALKASADAANGAVEKPAPKKKA